MGMKLNFVEQLVAHTRELVAQQDDDEALTILTRLTDFRDLPAEAAEMSHASLAEILMRRKKWTAARRHLTAALLHRPDCARYHYLMGMALASGQKADPVQAREHYQKALELDAELTDCMVEFGLFCLKRGDGDEGIALLHRAVAMTPDDPALLDRLVDALEALGRRHEARDLLTQARFRHPRDGRYQQLWQSLRYRETLAAQPKRVVRKAVKRPAAELVLLPFAMPKPGDRRALVRRDGPATLSPPHIRLHPARRSDMKQG